MKTSISDSLKSQIKGPVGYARMRIQDRELEYLRRVIRDQWLYRIQLLCPDRVKEFVQREMCDYHEVTRTFDHKTAWPKIARILPSGVVGEIRTFPFMKQLEEEFGEFLVSDEEEVGWEEFYWRIVRPGNSDVGPLHADSWFWDAGHGKTPEGRERVKVWLAIYCEKGRNGLRVIPGSHLRNDWRYHLVERDGFRKPQFDEEEDQLDIQVVPTDPADGIIFHDRLIHGGAPNLGNTTRVSLEFTLFVRKAHASS